MSDTSKMLDELAGPVSCDEAQEILSRFNASHWNNATEHARYSIPANPKRDDDIRLGAFIRQHETLLAAASEMCEAYWWDSARELEAFKALAALVKREKP